MKACLTINIRSENTCHFHDLLDLSSSTDRQLQTLAADTEILRSGVKTAELSTDALEQVRSLLNLSDQVVESTYRRKILNHIAVDRLTARFDEVENAHMRTFSWLLDAKGAQPSETVKENYARRNLIDWLLHGNGIFHISGKPGSGKSTLVKLLCETPETAKYLKVWAGDKSLVLANFFFSASGTKAQRSMNGLMRSLIHATLLQTPDLTQKLFPTQWSLAKGNKSIHVSDRDIEVAFDCLTNTDHCSGRHKFAFFIDGLDEYEGDPEPMVQQLFQWTRSNPLNIKICVSSRELLIFRERFSHCMKLRIHEITHRDIEAYVNARLADNEDFSARRDQEKVLQIATKVVEKADGVFLWVKVVIQGLLEGLLAEDRLEDLEQKVNEIPRELDELYQAVFDKLRHHRFPSDRTKAMRYLSVMVMHHSHPEARPLLLLDYSFLDEYDQNVTSRRPHREITRQDLEERLKRARKQLYRKCLGLLECASNDDSTFMALNDIYPHREKVRFIHRSFLEFLSQDRIQAVISKECGSFDACDFNLQCFAATLEMFRPDPTHIGLGCFNRNLQTLLFDNLVWNEGTLSSRFLGNVVDYLEQSGPNIAVQILPGSRERNLERSPAEAAALIAAMVGIYEVSVPTYRNAVRLLPIATLLGLSRADRIEMLAATTTNLIGAFITERKAKEVLIKKLLTAMDHIMKHGISPNANPRCDTFSIWMHLMGAFAGHPGDCFLEPVMRLFLLYGAYTDIYLCLSPYPKTTHFKQYKMALGLERRKVRYRLNYLAVDTGQEPMISIVRFARHHNWKVPLRDWIVFFSPPERVNTLQVLIDRNVERKGPPTEDEIDDLQSDESLDLDFDRGISFETHLPIVSRTMGLPDKPNKEPSSSIGTIEAIAHQAHSAVSALTSVPTPPSTAFAPCVF